MYIPITTALLALLTVAMLLLRIFWSRVPPRLRFLLIRASIAIIIVHGLFVLTKWNTTSDRLNAVINWMAVAGILVPLTHIFEAAPHKNASLGDNLFSEVSPWSNVEGGNKGVDVVIYYSPRFAPFFRHKLQTIPFNDQECDSFAASAVAFPAKKVVLGHCPNWPSQAPGTVEKRLPLR